MHSFCNLASRPCLCAEDGAGQVLFEHNSLLVLAEQPGGAAEEAGTDVRPRRRSVVRTSRGLREKLEPIVGESEELLTHLVPQLAAFA